MYSGLPTGDSASMGRRLQTRSLNLTKIARGAVRELVPFIGIQGKTSSAGLGMGKPVQHPVSDVPL